MMKKVIFEREVLKKVVKIGHTMMDIPQFAFKSEDLIKNGRTTKSNIEEIRKWLSHHSDIPPMSDEQVAVFLIACNNVIDATKTTIECYFKHKANSPEIFLNRDIDSEEVQFTLGVTSFAILPRRTKENYTLLFVSFKDTYYYNFHLAQQAKAASIATDRVVYSNPPNGLVVIMNFKGIGLMHLTRLKLDIVRKIMSYLQEAMPTQLRQVHILNASYVFDKILFVLKPFMKKELFEMIHPHPVNMPMEQFFEKYIPASCMPSDFGGELPPLEQLSEDFQKECRQLKAFLEADQRQIQRYKENVNSR